MLPSKSVYNTWKCAFNSNNGWIEKQNWCQFFRTCLKKMLRLRLFAKVHQKKSIKDARQSTKCFDYGNLWKFSAFSDITSRKNEKRKEKHHVHKMFLHKHGNIVKLGRWISLKRKTWKQIFILLSLFNLKCINIAKHFQFIINSRGDYNVREVLLNILFQDCQELNEFYSLNKSFFLTNCPKKVHVKLNFS